jgi:uncharacterized membrane protein YfcA
LPNLINPELLLPVLAIAALAGLVQGLAGFGSALVAVPLLALLLPVATVVPLVVLLSLPISLLNVWHLRRALVVGPVLRLLAGYGVGIPLGLVFLVRAPADLVLGVLGAVITGYALVSLAGYQPTARWLRDWPLAVGTVSGALGSAFSTNGPPVILHVAAHREWDGDRRKVTLALFFLISGLMTAAAHAWAGLIDAHVLRWFLWAAPTLLFGALTGLFLYRRLGDHQYRRLTFVLVLVSGLILLLRALR